MKALITGASSGLGADFARILHKRGFDLVLVARRLEKLENLKKELGKNVLIIQEDLSDTNNVYKLYEKLKSENIDVLINNAGFGVFGNFAETDIYRETEMIHLNVCSLHILTKLFLKDFERRRSGFILNVASSAGLMPGGPLMAAYYATKSYVVSLTNSIHEELSKKKSPVKISVLCPGPFDTEFNSVAGVKFSVPPMKSSVVADYAVKKLFKSKKHIIIPGFLMKTANFAKRFCSVNFTLSCAYKIQKKKNN